MRSWCCGTGCRYHAYALGHRGWARLGLRGRGVRRGGGPPRRRGRGSGHRGAGTHPCRRTADLCGGWPVWLRAMPGRRTRVRLRCPCAARLWWCRRDSGTCRVGRSRGSWGWGRDATHAPRCTVRNQIRYPADDPGKNDLCLATLRLSRAGRLYRLGRRGWLLPRRLRLRWRVLGLGHGSGAHSPTRSTCTSRGTAGTGRAGRRWTCSGGSSRGWARRCRWARRPAWLLARSGRLRRWRARPGHVASGHEKARLSGGRLGGLGAQI